MHGNTKGVGAEEEGKKNHKQLIADRFTAFLRDIRYGYGNGRGWRDQKRVFNNCAIYRKEIVETAVVGARLRKKGCCVRDGEREGEVCTTTEGGLEWRH